MVLIFVYHFLKILHKVYDMYNRLFTKEFFQSSHQPIKNLIQIIIDEWQKEMDQNHERLSTSEPYPDHARWPERQRWHFYNVSLKLDVFEQITRQESILKTLKHMQHGDMITATEQKLLRDQIHNKINNYKKIINNQYNALGDHADEYSSLMANEITIFNTLYRLDKIIALYPGIKTDNHYHALPQ